MVDFDFIKVSEREFFEGYSSLSNKKTISKSRIGNLRLKIKNEDSIMIERVMNEESINKKLKSYSKK